MKRSLLFAAACVLAGLGAHAAQSSCVECHTDEGMMKSLFVPPEISASEGEG